MSEVKIVRMSTGEDVICKLDKDTVGNYVLEEPHTIIPQQQGPGKPVHLSLIPYIPYAEDTKITMAPDKVVVIATPKSDLKSSFEQSTSSILQPPKQLIT